MDKHKCCYCSHTGHELVVNAKAGGGMVFNCSDRKACLGRIKDGVLQMESPEEVPETCVYCDRHEQLILAGGSWICRDTHACRSRMMADAISMASGDVESLFGIINNSIISDHYGEYWGKPGWGKLLNCDRYSLEEVGAYHSLPSGGKWQMLMPEKQSREELEEEVLEYTIHLKSFTVSATSHYNAGVIAAGLTNLITFSPHIESVELAG